MSEQRFITLESKVAYQEYLIEELRATTHTQYLAIEKLEKTLQQLTDRIKNDSDQGIDPVDKKPPHY